MKRLILPLATALLGIVAGFVGGRAGSDGGEGPVARGGPAGAQASPRAAGTDREADAVLAGFLRGRAVTELSAEELLALLRPEMGVEGISDPVDAARMDYQYRLLASRLSPETTEELLGLTRENGLRGAHVTWLLGAYVERDLDRAMAWVEKQPDRDSLLPRAVARLSLTDPVRAGELYRKELLDSGSAWSLDVTSTLAGNVARLGTAEFFKFYDGMPAASRSNLLTSGSRTLPDAEVPAFLAEARKRLDGRWEDSFWMDRLTSNMTVSHPEEIRKWLATMEPGKQRTEVELQLATSLSRNGITGEADGLLRSAMAGAAGSEKELLFGIMRDLVWENPKVADRLVNLLPEGQEPTLEDVRSWCRPDYPPETLLIVAKYLRSPEDQAAYLVKNFERLGAKYGGRTLNAKDFEILSHRLEAMDLSPEAVSQGKAALETARWNALEGKH